MLNVWFVHVWAFEHTCIIVARILPLASVMYASCQSNVIVSVVFGKYQ